MGKRFSILISSLYISLILAFPAFAQQAVGSQPPVAAITSTCVNAEDAILDGSFNYASRSGQVCSCVPPYVVVQPVGGSVNVGDKIDLFVGMGGSAPFQFQWRHNGVLIPGAVSANLVIQNATPSDEGTYDVQISNACGNVWSVTVFISVGGSSCVAPSIITQPQSISRDYGTNGSFAVGASGTSPLSYQWLKNNIALTDGGRISGSQTPTLNISSLILADAATYKVVVTNACGSATSNNASLTVNSSAPVFVQQPPAHVVVAPGNALIISALATGVPSPQYRWMKDGVDLVDGGRISGANSNQLIISNAQIGDGGGYALVGWNPFGQTTSTTAITDIGIPPTGAVASSSVPSICNPGSSGFTLSVDVSGGTPPFTYQWRSNGVNIPNATTNPYFMTLAEALVYPGPYDVVVSNSAGSIISNQVNVTINSGTPPVIVDQPDSIQTPLGSTAIFTVVANGSAPLSYQWRHNGVNIPGANSPTYTIPSVSNSDAGTYDVIVSNNCGTVTSNPATLSIGSLSCQIPLQPNLIFPPDQSTGISLTPHFTWSDVQTNPNCPVTYVMKTSLDPDNCATQGLTRYTGTALHFDLNPQDALRYGNTTYNWCVSASNVAGSSGFRSARFTTRNESMVERPNLTSSPYAPTQLQASGTQMVELIGSNGEVGSFAKFYQVGIDNALATVVINDATDFRTTVDVTSFDPNTGVRQYYVIIERPAEPPHPLMHSQPSNTLNYYYDRSLALRAPVLSERNDNNNDPNYLLTNRRMKIEQDPDGKATYYDIYRRIGLESCVSNCYLSIKPFTKVLSVPATQTETLGTRVYVTFSDDSQFSGDGVSYFAVARDDEGNSSRRSNSVDFSDRIAPVLASSTGFTIIPLAAERRAIVLICSNVDPVGQYFNGDNSPDLISRIQFTESDPSTNCDDIHTYDNITPVPNNFDALQTVGYLQNNNLNCILAGSMEGVTPGSHFCSRICASDPSGNIGTCSTNGQTFPNTTAPDFDGLVSGVALPSGTEVSVSWNAAQHGQNEVIRYLIQSTSTFNPDGSPVFSSSNNITTVNPQEAGVCDSQGHCSAVVGSLESGVRYAFQGSVIDANSHQNTPPNRVVTVETFFNGPQVFNLRIGKSPTQESYKNSIEFQVVDPQAGQRDTFARLYQLQYSIDRGTTWVTVDPRYLTGQNVNDLLVGNSLNSAQRNLIVFDHLAYFTGEQNFRMRMKAVDERNNITRAYAYSQDSLVNYLSTGMSANAVAALAGGCTTIADYESPYRIALSILFAIVSLGILVLRKNFGRNFFTSKSSARK